jgi:hypothetical protein
MKQTSAHGQLLPALGSPPASAPVHYHAPASVPAPDPNPHGGAPASVAVGVPLRAWRCPSCDLLLPPSCVAHRCTEDPR